MESQDLRIGNLFYKIDRTQKVHMPIEVPMVVAEIGIPFVKFYPLGTPIHQVVKYFDVELFSMTPIPLTEELLLKFGFKKSNDEFGGFLAPEFGDTKIQLRWQFKEHYEPLRTEYWSHFLQSGKYSGRYLKTEYVHQLQNQFYILSGGFELTINKEIEIDKKLIPEF